jgi:hypothetical protein
MGQQNKNQEALTINIDGTPSDGGDVRLSIFVNKLDCVRSALQETDKYLYGINKNTVEFLVSDLTHSSPSAVSIKMQPSGDVLAHQEQIFNYLSSLIADITSGTYRAASASYFLLMRLNELASGVGEKFSKMWLSYKGQISAVISIETQENLRLLLAKQYLSIGSIKGRMEIYHGHGKEKFFYVYPLIGDRVKCIFDDSKREQASNAVEKNVIVQGALKYLEGEFFPSEVQVHSIEINEPDDNLESLEGLIGMLKPSDNEQASVETVKSMRDGWH